MTILKTGLLLSLLLPGAVLAQATGDYLTADLRARVEKLKADLQSEPGNVTNITRRAMTLGDWANAYALDGGYLPVNLTQAVAAVSAYPDLASARPDLLDDYIREMTLKDEEPDAIGNLNADRGPFEARTFTTIRQTYTVGSRSISSGGGLVVARHFMPNYGHWQTEDPEADNFISISSDNRRVRFSVDRAPMSGMHGNFRGAGEALMFRVERGTLQPGDRVTVTYGDTSGGSRGFLMADFSSDRMPLPLYLKLSADGPLLSLPIVPIRVTGTRFAGLRGFAPSIVAAGETFEISLRAEDRYRNRAVDGHPDLHLRLNGEVVKEIAASKSAISIASDLRLTEPGVYRYSVTTADGSVTGSVNPVLVEAQPARRIYWGDTHGHSGFAEGIGTPDRFMTWARDDARLDYVTHSEHDIWLDDQEWQTLSDNVSRYSEEGRFIAYLGYEWTVRNFQGGHHNVLFRTPQRRKRIDARFYPTLSQLYQGLRSEHRSSDVLVIPHAHQAGDYRQNDPELEPLIEILSQHGNFEWFGQQYLQHGHQVGFTAASDNHLSQPGYSAPLGASLAQRGGLGAVLAPELSTDTLFAAMKARSTYATSGERLILDVSLNDTPMGGRASFSEQRTLTGRVIGTAAIDQIVVMKNDQPFWQQDYLQPAEPQSDEPITLLLSFASDSQPFQRGDNPRGWRHWRGRIAVDAASILSAEPQDFHNAAVQQLERSAEADNQLSFTTLTRGDTSSILLTLSNVRRNASLNIDLEGARETGGGPPVLRRHQPTPPAQVSFQLRDVLTRSVQQTLSIPGYDDTITLRRIVTNGPMAVSFEVEDSSQRHGDYYYVRVRQVDDTLAFSSPIWIGGFPSR